MDYSTKILFIENSTQEAENESCLKSNLRLIGSDYIYFSSNEDRKSVEEANLTRFSGELL